MNGTVTIALPHGFSAAGAPSREACLRELTGEEQLALAEDCQALPSAAWTTEVLTRCVTRLGDLSAPDRAAIRSLTVGDRDALLLHLHGLSFGQSIQCEVRCPTAGCAEKLELGLPVQQLLLPAYPHAAREHELGVTHAGAQARVRFRLPTGADHEAAAGLARTDLAAAVAELVQRCVLSVEGNTVPAGSFEQALSERMAELDPQAELLLRTDCPACGSAFRARFDVASFLRQRLDERVQILYREVHLLAFHYHWSERDILHLSARARQRYLQLLQAQLSRETLQ